METIKRFQHNINDKFFIITDRFPGLLALIVALVIFAGLIMYA